MPSGTAPGLYPVRAQLAVTGDAVDARVVAPDRRGRLPRVGRYARGRRRIVYLVGEPADVEVAAGDTARLAVTVGTSAGATCRWRRT